MGLKDFFKKIMGRSVQPDPVSGLTLANMKPGYFVDYDLKTWEVVSVGKYDWGSGDISYEWQLSTHDDTIFLELESDDEDYWTISRKLPFNILDPMVMQNLTEYGEPLKTIVLNGKKYFLSETGGAVYYKGEDKTGKEVFKWDYADVTEEFWLTIEQWGENEYELSEGKKVEEYQFSNILPSADGS